MATETGVDSGFVTVAPTSDPGGNNSTIDNTAAAVIGTSPANAAKITEVGWYCANATPEVNFEVGLYLDTGVGTQPGARVYHEATNAKGTSAGWKRVTVDWDIDPSTDYWIAVQVDNTSTTYTYLDPESGASRFAQEFSESALVDPFKAADVKTNNATPFYMLWEAGTEYVELSGAIVGVGAISGDLITFESMSLSGTISGVGTLSGNLGFTEVTLSQQTAYFKRIVAAGNNRIYYEDT